MVFCSQCGTELPEEGQFCPKCGSELPRSGYSARPSSESANITATLLHADKNARIIEVVLPVLTGYKCELCKHNIPNYSKCVEYSAIAYGMLPAKKHQHIECWNNGGYLLI